MSPSPPPVPVTPPPGPPIAIQDGTRPAKAPRVWRWWALAGLATVVLTGGIVWGYHRAPMRVLSQAHTRQYQRFVPLDSWLVTVECPLRMFRVSMARGDWEGGALYYALRPEDFHLVDGRGRIIARCCRASGEDSGELCLGSTRRPHDDECGWRAHRIVWSAEFTLCFETQALDISGYLESCHGPLSLRFRDEPPIALPPRER